MLKVKFNRKYYQKGFALIEVLVSVVVLVLGILALFSYSTTFSE